MHILVVWSNIFYLLAAVLAFYAGYRILAVIFLLVTISSTMHHSNLNAGLGKKTWSKLDSIFATIGMVALVVYGVQHVRTKGLNDRRSRGITMMAVIISAIALGAYGISQIVIPPNHVEDPDHGFTTPIPGAIPVIPIVLINNQCKVRSDQIKYLVYHTLWHTLSGLAGIFFITLIAQ